MPRMKTEAEVRDRLRATLGYLDPFFGELWRQLADEGFIRDYLDGQVSFADIVDEARNRHGHAIALNKSDRRGGRVKAQPSVPMLGGHETRRAAVLSSYIAGLADRRPEVQRFRQQHLESHLLSRDRALELLRSPTAAIPDTGPEVTFSSQGQPVSLQPAPDPEEDWTVHLLPFTVDGREDTIPVGRGSVLWKLRDLALTLARDYSWPAGEATWFVLTGDIPFVEPVSLNKTTEVCCDGEEAVVRRTRITITADAWISGDTVSRFFRAMQKVALRKDNRELDAKSLQVFAFVNSLAKAGKKPSWRKAMELWNRAHRDETMKFGEARHLAALYRRAHLAIVGTPARRGP